ncbi:zinc transporter ZntB [Aestuariibacter sp. AA17]|uniref:Zinc transporter ZntB n=1 Tax=Fluctibacter corallii TaxID=2984329 RepID=A0ABT3A742_9ALTE|nr:zinc transporter ZntB [Aestuariibacter sp. AA17]MCV2884107.1 zinc transporter ZntB [Aestuariibacter sp. AA17]
MLNNTQVTNASVEVTTGFYGLDGKGGAQFSEDYSPNAINTPAIRWLHLQSDSDDTRDILASHNIDDAVIDAVCIEDTRPKAHAFKGGILVYLRAINKNEDAEPEDMVSLRIWLTADTIITTRRTGRGLISIKQIKHALLANEGPASTGEFLSQLVANITDIISSTTDDAEAQIDTLELNLDSDAHARSHLSSVRKRCAALRRYLLPQREALESLSRIQSVFTPEDHGLIKDQYDRLIRYLEDLELVKERAQLLQDEIRNQISDTQGQRLYVLSLVTLVFLPLSFLTGVFGMNVAGLPGTETPNAFIYLSSVMGVIALLITAVMVWKKWF